ncbi:MAG TPA: S41 family peptidase [Candidatus Acidoferrales bacterium]|nr:S41 family peptidase [Candidatus Acidoferrales bacterium]
MRDLLKRVGGGIKSEISQISDWRFGVRAMALAVVVICAATAAIVAEGRVRTIAAARTVAIKIGGPGNGGSHATGATSDPSAADDVTGSRQGYYEAPAIHGDTIVFTTEGDLWTVSSKGGAARRLTSDPGHEGSAAISPDGKTVAFTGEYEGPADVYTMPVEGGLPHRLTWDGDASVQGWTPDGRVLVETSRYSTLPDAQLVAIDAKGSTEIIPLAQAAQGSYAPDGKTLYFTRLPFQGSNTKRYKGGFAENIWRYDPSEAEAVELTGDYAGTSRNPMYWDRRVYFVSDRDGVMNIYSMDGDGKDVKEHTHHKGFDVKGASISEGRIAYQCGADLWLLDLQSGQDSIIPITLVSDFDQMRDHWVKKPMSYLSGAHIAPDGSAAVFTARGEVFTMPAKPGRIVRVAGNSGVRYREARYLPDGKSIVALSTESGETEFWKFPANGVGKPEQWTKDATVLRWEGVPSPDGKWLAHRDKDQQLWIFDTQAKTNKKVAQSMMDDFQDLTWSPDSQWLAYVEQAENQFAELKVLNVKTGGITAITSDRYNSGNPAWSVDGKWLYFLSDRNLKTTVPSPWGSRQPDPHFEKTVKVYELALTPGLRSPFTPPDELHPDQAEKKEETKTEETKPVKPAEEKKAGEKKGGDEKKAAEEKKTDDEKKSAEEKEKKPPVVNIDFTDLASRLREVPMPAGNYNALQATEKRLCWMERGDDWPPKFALACVDIANKGDAPETVMSDVRGFEISQDRKKMLVRQKDDFYIFDAAVKAGGLSDPKALAKARIDLAQWNMMTNPRAEFRQFFDDAWRLERDYFYDRHMQGVNWKEMHDRYLPLVDRVADRDELNDVIAQMVSELSALHTFVGGGDEREATDNIDIASLGAVLKRDEKAGGYAVEHVYLHDQDLPDQASPLARPDSLVKEGETIVSVDGEPALDATDERALLRGKAGHQVLLHVKSADGKERDVLVTPLSPREDFNLRYSEWEYTRRVKVDQASKGAIGYVHLRAMGSNDIDQWAREYYPVFTRQGLIVDVRHNEGGNIDSWLLGKLIRPAWFYWQGRIGNPTWNMQYAFRGHIVVLCDQETASDGEAFSEGFRRLGLGKVIGMRTWGGEIWLSGSNRQSDNAVATAAETGVYGPEGKWLIEGHGVDPDIVVDNGPHATFEGEDQQLEAAMKVLQEEIAKDPRPVPPHPAYPDKSFKYDW